jgi:hypothetical protein
VDPASGPVISGWREPTGRQRSRWVRTGLVAAALWAAIGATVAFLSARAGAPTASGWLALLTGPVALLVVGQRARVRGRGDWILAGLLEFAIVLALGSVAIFFVTLSGVLGGPAGWSGMESVGFGTGGTYCTLATTASTFSPADTVRVVTEFSPELPAGTIAKISMSINGSVLASSRETLTLDAPTGCISGAVSDTPLAIGHYRWDISPDTGPPIGGEFDVTP